MRGSNEKHTTPATNSCSEGSFEKRSPSSSSSSFFTSLLRITQNSFVLSRAAVTNASFPDFGSTLAVYPSSFGIEIHLSFPFLSTYLSGYCFVTTSTTRCSTSLQARSTSSSFSSSVLYTTHSSPYSSSIRCFNFISRTQTSSGPSSSAFVSCSGSFFNPVPTDFPSLAHKNRPPIGMLLVASAASSSSSSSSVDSTNRESGNGLLRRLPSSSSSSSSPTTPLFPFAVVLLLEKDRRGGGRRRRAARTTNGGGGSHGGWWWCIIIRRIDDCFFFI